MKMSFFVFLFAFTFSASAQVSVSITFQVPSANNLKDVELSRFQQLAPVNNIGALNTSITSTATSITVTGTCPANSTAIYIDSEPMLVTAGSGTQTCTVTRNSALSQAGTTAAAHASGVTITQLKYANAQAYFVDVAVAVFLSQITQSLGANSAVIGSATTAIATNQATVASALSSTVVAQ